MKLPELSYFFESYNFPSVRKIYPTNVELWRAFNQQDGDSVKQGILKEIERVMACKEAEQGQIMMYFNQVGYMGPIQFTATEDMLTFLVEMKEQIS